MPPMFMGNAELKGEKNHHRHPPPLAPRKRTSFSGDGDGSVKRPASFSRRANNGDNSSSNLGQQGSRFNIPPYRPGNNNNNNNNISSGGSVASAGGRSWAGRSMQSEDGSYYEEILEDEYVDEEFIEEYVEEEVIVDEDDFMANLPPRKITIRFAEYDDMQTTLHINDYTKHEVHKAWFSRDDYDQMVKDSRKIAEKVESRSKESAAKLSSKKSKIESRGLEAWTSMGAAKVRMLKLAAIEAVWNEQSRQWDRGENDPDKIREAYIAVSKSAQHTAEDRAYADFLIAKKIKQDEEQHATKKQNRRLLGKSKALLGVTVRTTAGGVVKTTKLVGKTTLKTGKVAVKTTKAVGKAGVATATLDRKMLMNAVRIGEKKKEAPRIDYKQPSKSLDGSGSMHNNNNNKNGGNNSNNGNNLGGVDRKESARPKVITIGGPIAGENNENIDSNAEQQQQQQQHPPMSIPTRRGSNGERQPMSREQQQRQQSRPPPSPNSKNNHNHSHNNHHSSRQDQQQHQNRSDNHDNNNHQHQESQASHPNRQRPQQEQQRHHSQEHQDSKLPPSATPMHSNSPSRRNDPSIPPNGGMPPNFANDAYKNAMENGNPHNNHAAIGSPPVAAISIANGNDDDTTENNDNNEDESTQPSNSKSKSKRSAKEKKEAKRERKEARREKKAAKKEKKEAAKQRGDKNLKLLGVVPIPVKQKVFQEKSNLERAQKHNRRAAWEGSRASGKY